jgi:SAM-dependent methyltransferase
MICLETNKSFLKKWLAHPLTRSSNIDDPHTIKLRKLIILEKSFLRHIYIEWYKSIVSDLPKKDGPILELGSGAGFLRDFIPQLITSDILQCPEVDIILDGCELPFADNSLLAIVMTNVFHHLPYPRKFLKEAARCVKIGGVIIMIEPWVTAWSRLIYRKLHHEPFTPESKTWEFPDTGPLSGANGALPWIIFQRDREIFHREFPQWQIRKINLDMPFCYIISGGISLRSFIPGWSFGIFRRLEKLLKPWMKHIAMFAQINLLKTYNT